MFSKLLANAMQLAHVALSSLGTEDCGFSRNAGILETGTLIHSNLLAVIYRS